MSKLFRPGVEPLDARIVPAAFGNPWPSGNLTLSFAPDGTLVNGLASQLSQTFSGVPSDVWQQEILRAFQMWSVATNVNIGVVADGGQAFGTPGSPQGDSRFGDVRIGATLLDPNVAALASPFDVNAGTYAGDVTFNAAVPFGISSADANDIFTVALHEAGHVLGVDENHDPTSAMYDVAVTRLGLNATDTAAVQSLYGGQRLPDAFDAKNSNGTLKTASSLQVGSGPGSSAIGYATADITTATDTDVYVFQASNLRGQGLTATVHVNGYSLLVPKLEILDAAGNVIASGVGASPGAGDVSLYLPTLTANATYYARVSGGRGDVFGIGGYKLELRPDVASGGGSGGGQLLNPDAGTNDTLAKASQLGQQYLMSTRAGVEYTLSASLNTSTDVDFYKLKSPQLANNAPSTMTVSVWATQFNGTDPVVEVYDSRGARVAAQVLVHEGGAFTVQIASVAGNSDYYVAVRHAHPGAAAVAGNYFLGVDFSGAPVQFTNFSTGTLTDTSVAVTSFEAGETELLHLVFDLSQNAPSDASGARFTIVDADGNVVASRYALAGEAASANVYLKPGKYRVLIGGGTTDGSAFGSLQFAIHGIVLSDPVGPQTVATATTTAGAPPPPTGEPPIVWGSTPPVAVPPVTPTSPAWWVAPPTDWTPADWLALAQLLNTGLQQ